MMIMLMNLAQENCQFTRLGKKLRGQPVKVCAALVGGKGDLKFFKEYFESPKGWSSNEICTCCRAGKELPFLFTDCGNC